MLTLSRPAKLLTNPIRLDAEYRAARWTHNRLLDFEAQHQDLLDEVADEIAPGIVRIGRILARLARRERRAQRTAAGSWAPDPKPELTATLKTMLTELRAVRNSDPRWKAALTWPADKAGDPKKPRRRRAVPASRLKRRKNESDEAWEKRFTLLTTDETDEHYAAKLAKAGRRQRREQYRCDLYAQRAIYWGTWNALCKSVDQAVKDVIRRRKQGLPADWRRPKHGDRSSLVADPGGFRIIERGDLWWTIDIRLGVKQGKEAEWARVRAKCGNWHDIPDEAVIKQAKLTRRRDGQRWAYTLNLAIDGAEKETSSFATSGRAAFDWGHREHGHEYASDGIRAFAWVGSDGRTGEVLVPRECRECLDYISAIKARMDDRFNRRKESLALPDKTRHGYRRRLLRLGVRTEDEAQWLQWEMRQERRIAKRRKRFQNLRRETYTHAVRDLRKNYAEFVFEAESNAGLKRQQKDVMSKRRQRANRDLTARFEFVSLCERLGGEILSVSSRNTTKACPECGNLDENTAELLMVCSSCGVARDKDFGAARVILARSESPLAGEAAE